MSDLPKRLRIKAGMIALGERVAWGSDTALMEEAADVIEALSASVENHQLHMLGMARDRDQLRALLTAQPQASAAQSAPAGAVGTPGATWRANGEPDPHGDSYNCERAALAMGDLTDDELANGAFMNYDKPLNIEGILAGTHSSPIAWMTAVKDRIRWLSRKLDEALAAATAQPAALTYKDDPRSPSELSLSGCNCVRFGEGNPHWPCKIHPAQPAAQDQGEVQSRERWNAVCGHWQDTTLAIHGERTGHIASGIDEDAAHAIVSAHNQGLPPIASASTGQEVKHDA